MAFVQYLNFDGVDIPLPDSYEVELVDKEADSSGETEAGTMQRDIVRIGVATISVAFSVSRKWLKELTRFKQKGKVLVKYFNPETTEHRTAEMYVESFKVKLWKDTSYNGLWTVSFILREF